MMVVAYFSIYMAYAVSQESGEMMSAHESEDDFLEIRLPRLWAVKEMLKQLLYLGIFAFASRSIVREFSDFSIYWQILTVAYILFVLKDATIFLFDPPYKAIAMSEEGIAFDMRWGRGIIGSEWKFVDITSYKHDYIVLQIHGQKFTVKKAPYNDGQWGWFGSFLRRKIRGKMNVGLPKLSPREKRMEQLKKI